MQRERRVRGDVRDREPAVVAGDRVGVGDARAAVGVLAGAVDADVGDRRAGGVAHGAGDCRVVARDDEVRAGGAAGGDIDRHRRAGVAPAAVGADGVVTGGEAADRERAVHVGRGGAAIGVAGRVDVGVGDRRPVSSTTSPAIAAPGSSTTSTRVGSPARATARGRSGET